MTKMTRVKGLCMEKGEEGEGMDERGEADGRESKGVENGERG